ATLPWPPCTRGSSKTRDCRRPPAIANGDSRSGSCTRQGKWPPLFAPSGLRIGPQNRKSGIKRKFHAETRRQLVHSGDMARLAELNPARKACLRSNAERGSRTGSSASPRLRVRHLSL